MNSMDLWTISRIACCLWFGCLGLMVLALIFIRDFIEYNKGRKAAALHNLTRTIK